MTLAYGAAPRRTAGGWCCRSPADERTEAQPGNARVKVGLRRYTNAEGRRRLARHHPGHLALQLVGEANAGYPSQPSQPSHESTPRVADSHSRSAIPDRPKAQISRLHSRLLL